MDVSALIGELGYTLSSHDVSDRLSAYENPSSKVWIALLDYRIVGFLSFHIIPLFHTRGYLGRITAMAVSSSHRRFGIGSSLLAAAETSGWETGCVRIESPAEITENRVLTYFMRHTDTVMTVVIKKPE